MWRESKASLGRCCRGSKDQHWITLGSGIGGEHYLSVLHDDTFG
jgi:hypothetical protein